MSDGDDDLDFVSAFTEKFGSLDKANKRLADERKAGRTKKQRKPSVAKKQLNIRAARETHILVAKLVNHLQVDKTVVLERAIAALAKAEGIT